MFSQIWFLVNILHWGLADRMSKAEMLKKIWSIFWVVKVASSLLSSISFDRYGANCRDFHIPPNLQSWISKLSVHDFWLQPVQSLCLHYIAFQSTAFFGFYIFMNDVRQQDKICWLEWGKTHILPSCIFCIGLAPGNNSKSDYLSIFS